MNTNKHKISRLLIDSLCLLTTAMSVIVLRGWFLQDASVVQVNPDYAPMQFNTALCFLLASGSLWLLSNRRLKSSLVLAISCAALSGASGLQYLLGINLGIDTLFVDPFTTVRTSHAGRMAPNTAANFFVVSMGVLVACLKPGKKRSVVLGFSGGAFVFAIALVALLGYGTGLEGALTWGEFTRMALHTALGFLALGATLILIAIQLGTFESIFDIPLLPIIASTGVLLLVVLIWLALQTTFSLHLQSQLDKHDEALSAVLKTYLEQNSHAVERMAQRSELNARDALLNFDHESNSYLEDFTDMAAMAWLDRNAAIRRTANSPSLPMSVPIGTLFREAYFSQPGTPQTTFQLLRDSSHEVYLLILVRVHSNGEFNGYLAAVSRLDILLENLLASYGDPLYVVDMSINGRLLNIDNKTVDPRWTSQSPTGFQQLPLDIVVRASPELVKAWHTALPTVFLFVGLLLVMLVGTVLTLLQSTHRMTLALGEANLKLQNSLDQTKQARAELEIKTRALEHSNKDLENFASIAAHDLKEPLRKVTTFGDRLDAYIGEHLDDRSRKYLDAMVHAAERMDSLLDSLLAYSRVSTRGHAFENTDLNSILQAVTSDLSELIRENNAQINLGNLPVVQADQAQMRQLFQNLIANALRYRKEGIDPVIKIRQEPGDGNYITVTIADNGIGFEQQHADSIFEAFKRLHSRTEYPGSGMGLAVCKRIMERHRGTIRAEGIPGRGAKFILHFPAGDNSD